MVVETNGRALARQDEPIRDVASIDLTAVERVIVAGDLSKLSAPERWDYYRGVCQSVGLNPFTKPFEYITLNGKLTLYALKGATDQLRRLYGLSISEPTVKMSDGLCIVTVTGTDARGRSDSEIGAVVLPPGGEARANALMKALTKAKRRLTLSMCGLGMLDESEVETIPNAIRPNIEPVPTEETEPADGPPNCQDCGGEISGGRTRNGERLTPQQCAQRGIDSIGRPLCAPCYRAAHEAARAAEQDDEAI